MELEVGMYVRTLNGKLWIIKSQRAISGHKKDIINASYNIIDLIEVGDYVNGSYVEGFIEKNKFQNKLIITEAGMIDNNDIKSIVTKEQFENIEYKVGV